MDKNGYKSTKNQTNYIYQSNNSGNIKKERSPLPPKINNFEDELELFSQKKTRERPGKIIHQSTEQSFDNQGNRVIKTKTVREIGTIEKRTKKFVEPKNSISNNSQVYNQDRSNKKYYRVSKYSRINEAEKQKALYSSPDFQGGSPYGSPIYMNDIKNSNDFDEVGYKTNFRYETKKVNGKNVGSYTQRERYEYYNSGGNQGYGSSDQGSPEVEVISPVGYAANYSSGSEFDESQMRSLDNYPTNIRNEYNFNRRVKKNKNLNYEMEDPEGFDYLRNNERNRDNIESKRVQYLNRSEYRNVIADDSYRSDKLDFQSPDRNMNVPNKFRNVNVGMIDSKGPTNDDRKVTKILTTKTENVSRSKVYKNNVGKRPKNGNQSNLSKIDAARIIQAWWRRRYFGEEEIYNITVKKAIKLQSFIRGFLVRKKVLRYITLAIYYQSFCDKLQDVLCNHIKKEIFQNFKEKFLGISPTPNSQPQPKPKPAQDNTNYNNRRTKIIPIKKNMLDDVTRKEIIINKSKRVTQQQTAPQNRSIQTNKSSNTQSTRPNQYPSNNQTPMSYPSPIIYSNRTQMLHRSPDVYNHRSNYMPMSHRTPDYYQDHRNINYRINRSFDNIDYEENIRNIKRIPRGNRNYNYYYYNRVDDNEDKERERYISPTFGSLRNNNITTTKKVLTTNRTSDNFNIHRDGRRIMKSNTEQIYDNVNTSRKVVKTIVTSSKKKHTQTSGRTNRTKNVTKNLKRIPIDTSPNQIISGGTLSIIKLPNRRINNSESEGAYTQMKKKTMRKEVYTNKTKNTGFVPVTQEVDNQLSIGITKLKKEGSEYDIKNKRVREEFITYKEPEKQEVKEIIKEKIVIQKEAKPETAEEGNDRQIFDMKIAKGVAMSIGASTETREIIKREQKEIEIFKKREREKNKEIDKYKEDIEKQRLKNKYDNLRRAMKITEYWKKSILQRKFNQFKNNCFSGPKIYEIGEGTDFQFTHKPKQKRDFSTQFETEKVDEGSQAVIKTEDDEKKKVKNFDVLKIQNNRPFSLEKSVKKKEKVKHQITRSKLKIISKIEKEDYGQQSEPWKTEITKVKNNINIKSTKPETVEEGAQYTREENKVGQTKQIEIIQNKPETVDTEIQHEYPDNYIHKDKESVIEIKGTKPVYTESDTQYEKPLSEITKSQPLSFKGIPKKEVIKKVDKKDAQCNTFNETEEIGINAVVEEKPKPKNIEVQIRTVKRSLHSLEIPLLKKIWKRKAFKTFRDNCRRPEYHKILGRELLRMAFLRWRFVNGYGPDRYGNVYDRDGNLLYKTKGKVADMEVQQDFIVEKEDESTQYIPIENIISTLKHFEIGAAYKKKKEPEKVDQGVGSDIRMAEVIQKGESVTYKYKKKERPKNKISKNDNIEFKKIEKKLKDEGTEMPVVENKITKLEKINISNDEYKLRSQKNSRIKELLIQMIYKKMMDDKLTLSDALRQWLKQTILSLQKETNELDKKKRRYASISKAERFALIEEIKRIESGTQMEVKKNEVVKMPNINVIRIKKMKDSGVSADIPFVFDIEKIRPQNENKLLYKSSKKPLVLETHKENEMNIYSEDYIFREEVKKGIHHPITEEGKTRIKEILIKFFETRGSPKSALRKYFTTWYRKARYLACIDNARIIGDFCKRNLTRALNYKKWKKICEKLILREKIQIIKMTQVADKKRNKLFDLIRLTRINTVYAKRRYLHYILLCWLIYTRNINRKRKHIKALYENMLSTYMHMADDVFGNNQKENPSVQDALFEAVDSDKFHYKQIKDVPIAEEYYNTKKQIQKVTTNITYVNNNNDNKDDDIDEKEYITYKTFVSKHPIPVPSSNSREVKVTERVGRVIKVGEGEKLHSRGRGRKYRTKNEKEILNKFYSENRNYSKSKERIQKEQNEGNVIEKDNNNNIGEKKSVRITIERTGGRNRSFNKEEMRKIIKIENNNDIIDDNDNDIINIDNNNNNMKRTEMTYSERRKYFGKRFNDEDEKEIEDDN